ncbi:MAG: hypothetical protein GX587_12045, partial [Bacteroidales bacterium]|nr:hypothetical protein [Bacteroidales bacterium]
MKRSIIMSSLFIVFFLIPGISQENRIDLKTIPRLEKIYQYHKPIDTKPEKIGEYQEFDYLLEDDFSYKIKNGKSNVSGLDRIDVKITSSSFLKDKKEVYDAAKTFDGDINTAWCEGVDGFGFKEWLKFNIDFKIDKKEKKYLDGNSIPYVLIYPGLGRSKDLFYKNNRVKSLIMIISTKVVCDGDKTKKRNCQNTSVYRLNFEDVNKYQLFELVD